MHERKRQKVTIGFSEKDRKRIWKNHMEEIISKDNDWDRVTATSMVE